MDGLVWRVQDGFIHMSVGPAGRLGLPETVPWSTCHNDRRADLLNDGSGLEEQCSHHQGKTAWPFMT